MNAPTQSEYTLWNVMHLFAYGLWPQIWEQNTSMFKKF